MITEGVKQGSGGVPLTLTLEALRELREQRFYPSPYEGTACMWTTCLTGSQRMKLDNADNFGLAGVPRRYHPGR